MVVTSTGMDLSERIAELRATDPLWYDRPPARTWRDRVRKAERRERETILDRQAEIVQALEEHLKRRGRLPGQGPRQAQQRPAMEPARAKPATGKPMEQKAQPIPAPRPAAKPQEQPPQKQGLRNVPDAFQ